MHDEMSLSEARDELPAYISGGRMRMPGLGKSTYALVGSLSIFGTAERPEDVKVGIDSVGEFVFMEGREARSEAPPWMSKEVAKHGNLMVLTEPNGFVSNGLDVALNLLFGVSGPPSKALCVIVAKSSTNVASTDTSILGGTTAPTFTGGSQNAFSKVFGAPVPVAAAANAITAGISFTQADITGGSNFWAMNRVGLVNVAAATNLGLLDVIGNGAAQADPYSRTFSVDFSSAGTWTLNPQITITGVRRTADFPTL